ncbi:MAG: protein kinase, partial [Anaerolineales bacterium]|nr:protein kinase [Anaerolineales bacterium]
MLQDRYQIMGTLGVGGFSAVYQARDMRFPTVTKLCAVKEMVNTAPDPQMREVSISLFEREANILATLDHPSIPTVYDYFTEGERSYV